MMQDHQNSYVMEQYEKKSGFASFLPGIAGVRGIPIWCYYVNRGQGVVSFGVQDKNHSIMEFYPAHQAYQNVKRTGFRTFIRLNGQVAESFSDAEIEHRMRIDMNELHIEEVNDTTGLTTKVQYYTLPSERLGALVRCVTITNHSKETKDIEVLDGMPAVIPYGVDLGSMKNMGQTSKAWMQVEDTEAGVPYYRVRVSMADSASVQEVLGGNFAYGCLEDGTKLVPIVDPEVIFAYDDSLGRAINFEKEGLDGVLALEQMHTNLLPCAFFGLKKTLQAGESVTIYEMIGQVENQELLMKFFEEPRNAAFFRAKAQEATVLTEELCKGIATKTGNTNFDDYCSYTYMDNVLRGGLPMKLGNNKIFYLYSRKHGDLERDYNDYFVAPEFYSQGNGNFRDVNQNRRCDVFFAPFVGTENIHTFYSLIQLDGYNPLGIEKITYQMEQAAAKKLLQEADAMELYDFVTTPFTPGQLYEKLDDTYPKGWQESLFYQLLDFSQKTLNADFKEGYWSDHWTYNLDLIKDYLEVFPEKEKDLLYENDYVWFLSQAGINDRARRYAETPKGLRQYYAIAEETRRNTKEKLVRTEFGKGEVLKSTLLEKLILLCAVKFATLDAYGMGVEMEGGKPGWYDALNGMPGVFGSSMAETYELERMLEYTISAMKKYPGRIDLFVELANFLEELQLINRIEKDHIDKDEEVFSFWDKINDAKEVYRGKVYDGVSGRCKVYESSRIVEILEEFAATVKKGIEKAHRINGGVSPTYFTYEATGYKKQESGILPTGFQVRKVPDFLEGTVRYLKLDLTKEEKKACYDRVKGSGLYDRKLQMYKVNNSLDKASYELGRAKAFTPGWLENESIWLHMEYKYLLEVLRSGMYEEFFTDFAKAAVPFMDPEVYGRSILENSSFLASSANPNSKIHGKGFVARLSGSTIEFISMWKLMMFGAAPFSMKEGQLTFTPQPAIPAYLIGEDQTVEATLLGTTRVIYHLEQKKDYIPGQYECKKVRIAFKNGGKAEVTDHRITGKMAQDIRNGKVDSIEITLG